MAALLAGMALAAVYQAHLGPTRVTRNDARPSFVDRKLAKTRLFRRWAGPSMVRQPETSAFESSVPCSELTAIVAHLDSRTSSSWRVPTPALFRRRSWIA